MLLVDTFRSCNCNGTLLYHAFFLMCRRGAEGRLLQFMIQWCDTRSGNLGARIRIRCCRELLIFKTAAPQVSQKTIQGFTGSRVWGEGFIASHLPSLKSSHSTTQLLARPQRSRKTPAEIWGKPRDPGKELKSKLHCIP